MEDDTGDVVIEEQLKKKKALVKASEKEKKPPAKPKARKVSIAAHSPRGSTSTPAEPAPGKTKAKAKPVKPTKSVPFEEALREWFTPFAEEGEPGKMGADGIERLFEEMQISMDGVHAFILAWQVNSKPGTFGTFELADFERRLRPYEIASVDQLKKHLMAVEKTLYGPHSSDAEFRSFHSFLFPYLKAQGLRSLPPEMAIAALSVSIVPKYPLGEQFVEFATAQGDAFKSVSSDVWTQLLAFCQTVQPDLTNWSEGDAWPSTIDAFVEWKKAKDQAVSAA
ncbi:SPOSA6832_01446 [Sporobolomyces salmonicolor]|uniref:Defective in cullin neddylation protein n=1 Tax=Sporidiobolus salmonicolor TaxID=5005 RepID=A0A0D6EJG7_SPOSA|nr:SPOSA6832_01446 [Sporobolomyces salmonicolor]